jgi:oligogalacturonide lyase
VDSHTNVGKKWLAELTLYRDPLTGATVRQYTHYLAHSSHFYFTYPCWYNQGRTIIISSDRENRTNLFGVDLASGGMTQLTDFDPAQDKINVFSLSKNPVREEAYYFQGKTLMALNLETLEQRPLYTVPERYVAEGASATADGQFVCIGFYQDLSDQFDVDLDNGYVGFDEYWAARPHSMIVRVSLDDGALRTVFEEDYWLGHFNTSPRLPHIMTFCHEGPWDKVDNRIWGLDIGTGQAWKIRPAEPGESVGHEYWMPDGEHLGYHGRVAQGPLYGSIRYDNTDQVEAPFEFNSWHFHSHQLDLIVGDGDARNAFLLLWRFKAGRFEGPKALVWHRGSFHTQRVHVHPCFSADGRQIVYTADPQGYGQVFAVDIPDWDALPDRNHLDQ